MLTNDEINEIFLKQGCYKSYIMDFARDIERAVLAKAGEQKPVGFIDANGDAILSVDGLKGGYLYRDPLPAQAIPEYVTVSQVPHSKYAQGWNDCIDSMLSASPKP